MTSMVEIVAEWLASLTVARAVTFRIPLEARISSFQWSIRRHNVNDFSETIVRQYQQIRNYPYLQGRVGTCRCPWPTPENLDWVLPNQEVDTKHRIEYRIKELVPGISHHLTPLPVLSP